MKTIPLTSDQAKTLPFNTEKAADLTIEGMRFLTRWCDCQSAYLWDDMSVQEILNVYRASWEWDTWEGWCMEDLMAARQAWNDAIIDPGNRLVSSSASTR